MACHALPDGPRKGLGLFVLLYASIHGFHLTDVFWDSGSGLCILA
jgi:hypothetical protein